MKWYLTSLSLIAAALLCTTGPRPAADEVVRGARALLFDKELRVTGTRLTTREEILAKAPVGRSVLWWHLNVPFIRTAILEDPYVSDVSIDRCADRWSVRCFEVRVTERALSFLTMVNGTPWIVGDEGGFIAPLPGIRGREGLDRFLEGKGERLVFLDGVSRDGFPAEVTRGRLLYLTNAKNVIESEVKLKLRSMTLTDDGELECAFRETPMRAVFGYAGGGDLSLLGEEARRLGVLLTTFGERSRLLERVDVAFNKMAVVTLVKPKAESRRASLRSSAKPEVRRSVPAGGATGRSTKGNGQPSAPR